MIQNVTAGKEKHYLSTEDKHIVHEFRGEIVA